MSNKTNENRTDGEGWKARNSDVGNKHEEMLSELETSQTLLTNDDKKACDNFKTITTLTDSSVLSPGNCKANNILANETTRKKLIPVLKSHHRNDEKVTGQPCIKNWVSFAFDEKNDEECVGGRSGNSASVLPKDHHYQLLSTHQY